MEIQENNQLELFSQSNASMQRLRATDSSFLARIRQYDKTILIIIAIIISSIVSFSLGVEKGKKQLPERLQVAPKPQSAREDQRIQEPIGSFTIQIASYKSKTLAQKEAQSLKKKGLSPAVLSKGGYNVLCVGNFSSKKEAQTLLTELKKRYAGCYIRRL